MNWIVYRTGEDEYEEFELLSDAIIAMIELLIVSLHFSKKYPGETPPYPRILPAN